MRLMDALEDIDDVTTTHVNFDIDESSAMNSHDYVNCLKIYNGNCQHLNCKIRELCWRPSLRSIVIKL